MTDPRSLLSVALCAVAASASLWGGSTAASAAPPPTQSPAQPLPTQSQGGQFNLDWGDPQARGLEAGQCLGYFHPVTVVNGILEWGADTHCSGTGWYPHQLHLTLEKQEDTPFLPDWWFEWAGEISSPSTSFGSPDISLHQHWRTCDSTKTRKYRIVAKLTAGSHSTTALSDEYSAACDLDLD